MKISNNKTNLELNSEFKDYLNTQIIYLNRKTNLEENLNFVLSNLKTFTDYLEEELEKNNF